MEDACYMDPIRCQREIVDHNRPGTADRRALTVRGSVSTRPNQSRGNHFRLDPPACRPGQPDSHYMAGQVAQLGRDSTAGCVEFIGEMALLTGNRRLCLFPSPPSSPPFAKIYTVVRLRSATVPILADPMLWSVSMRHRPNRLTVKAFNQTGTIKIGNLRYR